MKSFREQFQENYEAYEQPRNNRRGFTIRYRYIGFLYTYHMTDSQRFRRKGLYLFLLGSSTICYLLTASRNHPLNQITLSTLFAMLGMAAFVYEAIGVGMFVTAPKQMEESRFQTIEKGIKIAGFCNASLLFAAALCGSCLIISQRYNADSYYIPAGYMICSLISLYIFLSYRKLTWNKRKNEKGLSH